ncbi:MAG: DUF202 domain-containing protein [Mucilaginibacter sp.]
MSEEHNPMRNPSDHLANERTFLAWIRTSIAIMGFGFVVVKFALFIKQLSLAFNRKEVVMAGKGYSTQIGVVLVTVGAILALYAYFRYRVTEKQLINQSYRPSYLPFLILTLAILTIGILLAIYLIPGI